MISHWDIGLCGDLARFPQIADPRDLRRGRNRSFLTSRQKSSILNAEMGIEIVRFWIAKKNNHRKF